MIFWFPPLEINAPLGFEPFDSAIRQAHGGESNRTAHGPEQVEGLPGKAVLSYCAP